MTTRVNDPDTTDLVLQVIRDYVEAHGYPLTVREIRDRVHLSSVASVHEHLNLLVHQGRIERASCRPRAIRILPPTQ